MLLQIHFSGELQRCAVLGGFLGSESKFIVPLARLLGTIRCIAMKLASDPNNPVLRSGRLALHPENEVSTASSKKKPTT